MKESQMSLINKFFNDKTIRTVWKKWEEKYYVDMVSIISESKDDKYRFTDVVNIEKDLLIENK